MKTPSISEKSITRQWFMVDATNAVVGRLATRVASVLRGKHKPTFCPHLDQGDFVVVINADKARFTGKKETDKKYWHYTGFPGGARSVTPSTQRSDFPERMMQNAIKGMLPKGPLGRRMLLKLKVYAGENHPHAAQQPQPLVA